MSLKVGRYCLCGAAVQIQCSSVAMVGHLLGRFDLHHVGDGHGWATRQQAANARRRDDRQRTREYARRWDESRAQGGTDGSP